MRCRPLTPQPFLLRLRLHQILPPSLSKHYQVLAMTFRPFLATWGDPLRMFP